MGKRSGASVNVGASSILVIFVLLCLTTFATLSLLSANADLRLTQKAEAVSDNYWNANNKAEQIVAQIDAALSAMYGSVTPQEAYIEAAIARLLSGETPVDAELSFQSMGETTSVSFTVPVGETQELWVELTLEQTPAHYHKTAWLLRSTVDWEGQEEPLDLWDGGALLEIPD